MPDSTEEKEKEMPILIEFRSEGGIETVALFRKNPEEVKPRSEKALVQAMNQIIDMASRINSLQEKMPKDFSQVEVEFGINFNWEVGAVLAKAGAQANINVTLTWTKHRTVRSLNDPERPASEAAGFHCTDSRPG